MPFKSKAQETFLKINYPEIARKWVKESKRYNQALVANHARKDSKFYVKTKKDSRLGDPVPLRKPKFVKNPRLGNPVPLPNISKKKEPKMARNKNDVYKNILNKKVSKKNNQAKVKVKKENGKTITTTTGTVRGTGKTISSPTTSKDGVYSTTKRIQVHTPKGKRWYEGTG